MSLRLGGLVARRIERGDESARAGLQDLLERCADYMTLEDGAPPGPAAASDLIDALPPDRTHEHKHLLGLARAPGAALCAVIDVVRDFPDERDWFVGLVLIDPAERGRGLGAAIMADLEDWLRQQGAVASYLAVLERNPDAQRFWSRQGYQLIDRRVRVTGTREDPVFRMVKPL
ncbi:MAG TPA: GNAT family N-acetyltransferase [Kofleriaceae bacterium]|nr:GNAT family N-acetyltransferase [Kofleriaceae bacterium]